MKYQPLADFLTNRNDTRWDASFAEIERVLRFPLPRSAFDHQPWWANQTNMGHSQAKAWRSAGWRTARVNLAERRVTFLKDNGPANADNDQSGDLRALEGLARLVTGIDRDDTLHKQALEALVARRTRDGLIALGGTMPDYASPARERS